MNALEWLITIGAVLFIMLTGTYTVVNAQNKIICLDHGYKHTDLTWDFQGYCIKRVDQTDVVISMEKL